MIILGIETSCDDTGIAILEVKPAKTGPVFNILSNVVSSQIKTHAPYGGVVPNLAAREHLKNIEPCIRQASKEAKVAPDKIDLIAVTIGPGLIPSLLIGVNFAKALAYRFNKPIVGVNHIEAHIIAALAAINPKFQAPNLKQIPITKIQNSKQLFPAIALVVSGGHTQLVLMNPPHQKFGVGGKYKILGETRDDAAGECFDKVAKLLGLGYPGGPIVAAQAAKIPNFKHQISNKYQIPNTKYQIRLPRPMINHKNYDFSFSGLKTAVLYWLKDNKDKIKNRDFIPEMCYETQQAIIDVLIGKTLRATQKYKAKTIILSGGVAANEELRKQFAKKLRVTDYGLRVAKFLVPPRNLCVDNGTMIAMAGYFNQSKATKNYNKIKANANLRIG